MKEEGRIIIVGAGAAGLMAARELRRAGRDVLVLEAADRVGGRILTLYDSGAGVPIELGAEFVHGEAPETRRLLAEARLATVPVLGERVRLDRGRWVRDGRPWRAMARVFARMEPRREPDRSFQEFLDERPGGRKLAAARAMARGFVQGFHAADPARISERSLARLGAMTEGAERAARIVPGHAALVAHLEREVGGSVRLGAPVIRIDWGEEGAGVLTRDGSGYAGRAAVVTVPLPVLQDDSLVFEPEVPRVRSAAGALVMGHAARATLVLRDRFWEEKLEKLSFVHSPGRPFHVWWTTYPLLAPVLVGWSGGPPALALMRSGEMEETAVRELARTFRLKRARAERLVESVHAHDWTHHPLIRGVYSYVGVGGTGAAKRLARPVGKTLFFAGEATDEENVGTVEGALASGRRVAKQVLRAIG